MDYFKLKVTGYGLMHDDQSVIIIPSKLACKRIIEDFEDGKYALEPFIEPLFYSDIELIYLQ